MALILSTTGLANNCVTLTRYFYPPEERPLPQLTDQLIHSRRFLQQLLTRPVTTWQYEALVCLLSDIMAGLASAPAQEFGKSTFVWALNRGMLQVVAGEFFTFCYVNGQINRRAWDKRRAEHYLFTEGRLLFD